MLKLKNIRVRSFDTDYLDLYWEPDGTEDPTDWSFQILRSDTEFGQYVEITNPFSDRYHFRDTIIGSRNAYRHWYYKIRIISVSDPSVSEDQPAGSGVRLRAEPDLEAVEMSRMILLRLQEFTGRVVWIYPIRTFGTRCTSCYDIVTQQRTRSKCLSCFDTGFVGGFHSPIQTYMEIKNPADDVQTIQMMETQVGNTVGKLSNYPEVQERWLVVEHENVRWRVTGPIQRIGKLRSTVWQSFGLHRVPLDDITYKLPLDIDPDNIAPSPRRQYTLPSNLEVADYTPASVADIQEWIGPRADLYSVRTGSSSVSGGGGGGGGNVGEADKVLLSVVNGSTSSVQQGDIVAMVSQSHADASEDGVVLASAAGHADISNEANDLSVAYGIVKAQITGGASGQVIRFGRATVRKESAELWLSGDPIYLSTVKGRATKSAPTSSGQWVVEVGVAAESSSGETGIVDFVPRTRLRIA